MNQENIVSTKNTLVSNATISDYLSHLKLKDYPEQVITRRQITFKRFLDTYGDLNKVNILDFIEASSFFREQTYNLLKTDWLSFLRYCHSEADLDENLFIEIDRQILGF